MQKYIGTKQIEAQPEQRDGLDGYAVRYADGYTSWSPKGVFDEAYRRCDAMTFGLAIEAMKKGFKVARAGWNGKNMFLFLREGRQITGVDAQSPMGGDFESRPHVCMKDAQGKCVVGWLASQTDMLSEDWYLVD